jgi:hypothetical protein
MKPTPSEDALRVDVSRAKSALKLVRAQQRAYLAITFSWLSSTFKRPSVTVQHRLRKRNCCSRRKLLGYQHQPRQHARIQNHGTATLYLSALWRRGRAWSPPLRPLPLRALLHGTAGRHAVRRRRLQAPGRPRLAPRRRARDHGNASRAAHAAAAAAREAGRGGRVRHTRGAGAAAAARGRGQAGAGDACAAAPTTSRSASAAEDSEAVEANSCCEEEGRRAGGVEGVEGGWWHVIFFQLK